MSDGVRSAVSAAKSVCNSTVEPARLAREPATFTRRADGASITLRRCAASPMLVIEIVCRAVAPPTRSEEAGLSVLHGKGSDPHGSRSAARRASIPSFWRVSSGWERRSTARKAIAREPTGTNPGREGPITPVPLPPGLVHPASPFATPRSEARRGSRRFVASE